MPCTSPSSSCSSAFARGNPSALTEPACSSAVSSSPPGRKMAAIRDQLTGDLSVVKECFLQGGRAGLLAQLAGAAFGQDATAAQEHQPIAALRLVHHRAGDEDRKALLG